MPVMSHTWQRNLTAVHHKLLYFKMTITEDFWRADDWQAWWSVVVDLILTGPRQGTDIAHSVHYKQGKLHVSVEVCLSSYVSHGPQYKYIRPD